MTLDACGVAIIGAGAFGTALANLVAGKGTPVALYADGERKLGALHANVRASSDLRAVTGSARLLILAVASPRVADAVRALGDVTTARHLLVHAVGVPTDASRTVSDLVRVETPVKRVGVLAGPALARDLADRKPCAVVVGSPFDEVIVATRAVLDLPGALRVYGSHDRVGIELSSAISGAMTVGFGLADGLGVGAGPRAVLMTRAVAEGTRVTVAAGAEERTFAGLAGLGNLLVRSAADAADRSDDYRLGLEIAMGKGRRDALTRKETEGSRAAVVGLAIAERAGMRARFLAAVAAVVHGGVSVTEAAARLVEGAAENE